MKKENGMYYLMNKNEKIAKTAFEGGLHGRHLSTTSPEYGTDGSFAKCWIRLPYAVEPDELPTVVLITGSMDRGSVTTG